MYTRDPQSALAAAIAATAAATFVQTRAISRTHEFQAKIIRRGDTRGRRRFGPFRRRTREYHSPAFGRAIASTGRERGKWGQTWRAVSGWIYTAALICSVGNFNGAIARARETEDRKRAVKGNAGKSERDSGGAGGNGRRKRHRGGEAQHLGSSPNSSMINTFVYFHALANRIESRPPGGRARSRVKSDGDSARKKRLRVLRLP